NHLVITLSSSLNIRSIQIRVMSSAVYDTLILSDLHLGSDMSRADEARRMLRQRRFRRLILLGDIFSDLNFGRLTKQHWRFLSYLRKLDSKNKPVARFLDRLNTRWLRMSAKVASGALVHARAHGVHRIFCGHTHAAMQQQQDDICYYNSGGWIDSRPTYITIGEEG